MIEKPNPGRYIAFISDSVSFDYYDLHSEDEKFCMTFQEVCDAVTPMDGRQIVDKVVTPSIANLRYWSTYVKAGYRIFLYKNGKRIEIERGLETLGGHVRECTNVEAVFLLGELDRYFR